MVKVVTFEELVKLERAWVEVQLEEGLTREQIAINLGYVLCGSHA